MTNEDFCVEKVLQQKEFVRGKFFSGDQNDIF
jgi:hypothetical protein